MVFGEVLFGWRLGSRFRFSRCFSEVEQAQTGPLERLLVVRQLGGLEGVRLVPIHRPGGYNRADLLSSCFRNLRRLEYIFRQIYI